MHMAIKEEISEEVPNVILMTSCYLFFSFDVNRDLSCHLVHVPPLIVIMCVNRFSRLMSIPYSYSLPVLNYECIKTERECDKRVKFKYDY